LICVHLNDPIQKKLKKDPKKKKFEKFQKDFKKRDRSDDTTASDKKALLKCSECKKLGYEAKQCFKIPCKKCGLHGHRGDKCDTKLKEAKKMWKNLTPTQMVNSIEVLQSLNSMKEKNYQIEFKKVEPSAPVVLSTEDQIKVDQQKAAEAIEKLFNCFSVEEGETLQNTKDKDPYVLNQSEMLNELLRLADFKDLEEFPTEKIHVTIGDKISIEFLLDSGSDTQVLSI
jgi:hypothetical protein